VKKNKTSLNKSGSIKSNSQTYEFTPSGLKLLNSVKRNSANIFDEPTSIIRSSNLKDDASSLFLGKKRVGSVVRTVKREAKEEVHTPKI